MLSLAAPLPGYTALWGAYQTLEAVVCPYNNVPVALREYDASQLSPGVRPAYHGDEGTINAVLTTLDHRLRTPLNLTTTEMGRAGGLPQGADGPGGLERERGGAGASAERAADPGLTLARLLGKFLS